MSHKIDMLNKFTIHPRAKAPKRIAEGYSLFDIYDHFSAAKYNAWSQCHVSCIILNGWGLCITSHNTFTFTVMFDFENPENGREMRAVITRDHKHAYYLDN